MPKPNIILINCDDLGYGDLGCYGSPCNKTPAIDRLAREGTRFTDFYMASPVCSPSRGGMMTGCYPPRIGFGEFDGECVLFPGQGMGLNPAEDTIPSVLRGAGYRTKIVGKWHCGDQPEFLPRNYGFEEYFGLPYSNDMGRQANRLKINTPLPLLRGDTVIQQQPDLRALTERYADESLAFIEAHRDEPFFLYLAHMHVHTPLYAAERFVRESENGDFGACVAAIDWATDCILHKLDALHLTENTLVIFTSDNGSRGRDGASNAPLRGEKTTTWEGGQRVPCIVRQPGTVPAGRESAALFASIDFLPTFAALGGAAADFKNPIDGRDRSALLFGDDSAARETFFYYHRNSLEAVRCGKWKLHVRKKDEEVSLLYDLDADIGETVNLYDAQPEIVRELQVLLEGCRAELGDEANGIAGAAMREIGRVANPKPLTVYDENHPYIIAMYDRTDIG